MRNLIAKDREKCAGCNRCIRVCQVPEANVGRMEDGQNIYGRQKYIICGACRHEARNFAGGLPAELFCPPGHENCLKYPHYLFERVNCGRRSRRI